MNKSERRLQEITPVDLESYWLWEFVPSKDGDLWVKPIRTSKTSKFSGRLVACQVTFADASTHPALLQGIDLEAPEYSRHNRELLLWVEARGWFCLAQYFDGTELQETRGPEVLAKLVGKRTSEIFPIHFDIRHRSTIDSSALIGEFEMAPVWGLPRSEIMDILVRELK